jgi:DNA-binding MarR family transcriptional regulator
MVTDGGTWAGTIEAKLASFAAYRHTPDVARDSTKRSEIAATELREILRKLTRRLRAESAGNELSHSEHAVLRRLLEHGPSTTAALARAEWVKPQSMGVALAALEEGGFVERTSDATDGRIRTVSITEEGKRVLVEGRAARQSWLARRIGEALDAEEQRTLLAALDLLRRIVDS